MRITSAEARRLGVGRSSPRRPAATAPPHARLVGLNRDILEVWLPGILRNHSNSSHGHWAAVQGYRNRWRDKTVAVIGGLLLPWAADLPKVVTFRGRSWGRQDDDGLAVAVKGVRDGLTRAGVIHVDSVLGRHRFVYKPGIDRKNPGVAIEVYPRYERAVP